MPRFVTEKSPQSLSTPFHHAISEVHYRWQGMALSASEKRYADGSPALREQWHYRGDFDLLAKEARAANDEGSDFYPIVSGPDGAPQEMYSANGRKVWTRQRSLWGRVAANDSPYNARESCDAGFMGQWQDEESGLWYNLHRYYDAGTGQYVSPDPIGLAGGLNTHAYVHNPVGWCDPWGLAACPGMYDWYKYNRSRGMTAAQAHRAIKNASPQDVFNYALHRQGMSGRNYPVQFKEKFTAGNYKYEIRAHDVNSNAPPGSNSANGPIYRVGRSQSGTNPTTNQGYGWEHGSPDGSWHHTSMLKPNSPNYNPSAANDTHIPLPTGVVP